MDFAPDPAHHETEWGKPVDGGPDAERIGRKYSDSEPFSAYCFRTVADPFAGRINVFKIISGHLQTDANALNSGRGLAERLGALHLLQGKQLDKVTEAHAGDIVACVKLKETQTGDTLCDKQRRLFTIQSNTLKPRSLCDRAEVAAGQEKISAALHKILEEDQALHFTAMHRPKSFSSQLGPSAR